MYVCMFVLYVYILYKHTGPDTCHIHRTWQSKKTPAQEYKTKIKNQGRVKQLF